MCLGTSDWIALTGVIATGAGVLVIWKQTSRLADQLKLQHFSDYTKRYQEIILCFPEDVNSEKFVLEGRKDYASVMRHMRAYLDLCFEEWHLNQENVIDSGTWRLWSSGMKTAFSKTAFQQAWERIKKDTEYGAGFEGYIELLIRR